MTVDTPIIVYTREGCHLCGLAIDMLERAGIRTSLVDIDADPELEQRYGNQVPVLLHPDSGRELFFPFDDQRLRSFARGGL